MSTFEVMNVLLKQEANTYQVSNYLEELPRCPQHAEPVDASCRQVMAKWCNEISDFCNYSRETTAVAMNCLDRFMATSEGRKILLDRNQYQLASMTALYTAVKIHEHEAMDPALVSSLSRGVHTTEAVENMERRMLNAIRWRVNPPTAFSFAREMLKVVPTHLLASPERENIMEMTQFQITLAISDYELSLHLASHIAFASLLNAVENTCAHGVFYTEFESMMATTLGIGLSEIQSLRITLYELVNGCAPMVISVPSCNDKDMESHSSLGACGMSPRSVNA